jgi:tRNA (adenine-N(1)-)-methyltransferase non-catalytic subunit
VSSTRQAGIPYIWTRLRFSKYFTVIEPTLYNVAEYWFAKDQNRIRDLRADALSQLLHLGDVHPGGRYLVVDDVSGLLVSAVLDRLNGQSLSSSPFISADLGVGDGRLLSIGDVDGTPSYPVITQMNFSSDVLAVHANLNWATADPDYVPGRK